MVDGVYQDIVEALKPGIRERDRRPGQTNASTTWDPTRSRRINAVKRRTMQPAPAQLLDRLIRPGDQAFFDIIHSYNGYRTCLLPHVRRRQRHAQPARRLPPEHASGWTAAIAVVRAGVGTDQIARRLAEGNGVRLRHRDGRLRPAVSGHGLALAARTADHLAAEQHEKSRGTPDRHGFAAGRPLPGADGFSAARIEEEDRGHRDGPRVLTLFPLKISSCQPVLTMEHQWTVSSVDDFDRPAHRRQDVPARSGDRVDVLDPATGGVITTVADGGVVDGSPP